MLTDIILNSVSISKIVPMTEACFSTMISIGDKLSMILPITFSIRKGIFICVQSNSSDISAKSFPDVSWKSTTLKYC